MKFIKTILKNQSGTINSNQSAPASPVSKPELGNQPPYASRRTMLALEPRIMFDGAAVETAVDSVVDAKTPVQEDTAAVDAAKLAQALTDAMPPAVVVDPIPQRTEIVFIESSVNDYQALINGVCPNAEVHVLDASQDGLAQMAEILNGRSGIDAIHIISHGSVASVGLGALTLTAQNLQDHSADLTAIGHALNQNADILLYGCDVAKGSDGAVFISALAQKTEADVAASTNLTGASRLGGDWTLETSIGAIETKNPVDAWHLQHYDHFLAAPTITNLNTDSVAWAGVGNTVSLDGGTALTIVDTELDAANWNGSSLTVQRIVGSTLTPLASDVFSFNESGFTVSGSDLQTGGSTTFGTFTNTNGVLTISFNASATNTLVRDVMRGVLYRNDTPTGDTAIRFSLSDGSLAATADVTVTSDTIYVTNTADTATIDISDGVSFSEAVAIALADATGSQTLVLNSAFATTGTTLVGNLSIDESLTVNTDAVASGTTLTGSTITIGSGYTLTVTNITGKTTTVASALAGTGALTKSGAGTLTLSDTNNASGFATSVLAGTLSIANKTNIGTGTITLDGGTLTTTGAGTTFYDGTISGTYANEFHVLSNAFVVGSNGGTITSSGGQVMLAGALTGSGTLTNGAGGLNLANADGFSGNFIVSSFLEAYGTSGFGSGTITLNSNAQLWITGSARTITNNIVLAGNATLETDSAAYGMVNNAAITLSGVISQSGGARNLTLVNGGSTNSFILSGTNSYTGTTTINSSSTVSVAADSNLGSGTVSLGSGAKLAITGATTIDNAISLTGAATITNSAAATISGVISGTGTLTKAGSSTLTLSGANTYTSATTVSAGTLVAANATALGTTAGTTTVSNGASLGIQGGVTVAEAVSVNGIGVSGVGALVNVSGTNTLSGNVTMAAGSYLGATAGGLTLSGTVSGNFTMNKVGAGTLTLSGGSNTRTGTNTVAAGTLNITGTLGSGAVIVRNGATLSGTGTLAGGVAVNSGGTLSPGVAGTNNGVGKLTLSGGLSIASGGILAADINGTTAGTTYDQVDVTGTVTVTGATLTPTVGYTPGGGDSYILINNDVADAITGTFTNAATTITVSGKTYTASYIGSSGNDFTLTSPISPSITVTTATLSADTGSSATDFITKTAGQTITGDLSAALSSGESVEVSYDNGATWATTTTATTVGATTWSTTATLSGNNTFQARVTNTAGGSSTAYTHAYTLDTVAPATSVATAVFSADTGTSSTDFITKTAAQTISGTLSGVTVTGEIVEVSLDNGSTWTTATNNLGQDTWSLSGQTLTASDTLKVRVTDAAGNGGTAVSQAYVLDTTASAITFSALAFSADTGTSSSDFITKTAAQTITATLSGAPAGTDIVYGSLDNGTTWTDITGKVSGTTLTWNGVTLTGSDTLQLKVTDEAGNDGTPLSQTYVLDTVAPAFSGAVANQTVTDKTTITPFSGLTLGDTTVAASALTQTVTITLDDPAKGALSNLGAGSYDSGTGIYTVTGTVTQVNTAIQGVIFTPTANHVAAGETETTTFAVVSTDVASNQVTNNTTTVVTTSVNDAPTLTNLSGDSINFSIGGSGVALDNGGNATVADLDSVNFNGGNVTVSITHNGQTGEDVLQIGNVGNITVADGNVSDNGTQIGTYTGGTAGAALVISLNASTTPALVQDLIRAIEYNNTSATTVNTAARTVTLTINDGGGTANGGTHTSSTQTMTVNLLRAPIIDLNGGTTGNDYSGAFTEGGGAVAISDGVAGMSDDGTISTMTVTITNLQDGASESLSSTMGTEFSIGEQTVTIGYDTGTGVLTITGTDISPANMSEVLQSIRYNNTATAPGTTARVISIAATDNDAHVGNAVTSTISVTAVNDAPTVTNNATYIVTGINENTASAGVTVNTVLTGNASWADPDGAGVAKGIAVTGTVGNGNWQYSTDGETWVDFGTVSATSALLLDGATQIRYQPDTLNSETATFSYRAWDETTDTASTNGTRQTVDPGVGGTTTAYSVNSAGGSVTVSSVNDAPTGVGNLTLAAVNEDTANPLGTAISELTGYNFQDIDTDATSPGILVVANTADAGTEGEWQYSSDGGTNWKAIGMVADDATALALASTTQVRFVPASNYNGAPSALSIRVLDNSYEAEFSTTTEGIENRVTVDSSSNGGATAISGNLNTIGTSITAVNDVPVFIKGADQTVNEDAGAQTVVNWATELGTGSANESAQTINFIVSNNNNALFSVQPTIDRNGNLSYTLADNANGTATVTVSLSDNGGTAHDGANTSDSQTFTITVNPVNDLPTGVVSISGTPVVGDTLTVANSLADVDGLGPISYQWQANGIDIYGATGSSYVLTAADVGKTISVIARYTDAQGTAESKASAPTAAVASADIIPININQQTGNTDNKPGSDIGGSGRPSSGQSSGGTGNSLGLGSGGAGGLGGSSGLGGGLGGSSGFGGGQGGSSGFGSGGTAGSSGFGSGETGGSSGFGSGSNSTQTIVVDMKLSVDSMGNGTSGGSISLPSSAFAGLDMSGEITISATQSSGQSLPSFISVNPSTGAVTVKDGAVVTNPITVKVTIRDSQGKQVVVLVKVQPKNGRSQGQGQGQGQQPDNGERNQQPDGDNQQEQGRGQDRQSQLEQTDNRLAQAGKPGLTQQLQKVGSKGFELQRLKLLDSLASLVSNDQDAA